MYNYPKVRAAVRMPDGTTLEVVEFKSDMRLMPGDKLSTIKYVVRDKATLKLLHEGFNFTRSIGEIYGRVKAMEEKIEKAKKENKQYCANCQCLLEL